MCGSCGMAQEVEWLSGIWKVAGSIFWKVLWCPWARHGLLSWMHWTPLVCECVWTGEWYTTVTTPLPNPEILCMDVVPTWDLYVHVHIRWGRSRVNYSYVWTGPKGWEYVRFLEIYVFYNLGTKNKHISVTGPLCTVECPSWNMSSTEFNHQIQTGDNSQTRYLMPTCSLIAWHKK